jgi:hypothetical protein
MLGPAPDTPPDDELEHDFEEVRAKALTIKCPRCGMAPALACQSVFGRLLPNLHDHRPGIHAERLAVAKDALTFEWRHRRAA